MLKPLSNYVFLKVKEIKKPKGVLLSDTSSKKPPTAEVVAIGPGRKDKHGNFIKSNLKKGDIVVIDPFLPREIKVDDKDYLVVRENEIFAQL